MVETFLQKFAKQIAQDFDRPGDLKIVLPTKRAVTFLKQELAKVYNATFWAPEFYALDEFVAQYSSLEKEENILLVLELYEVYLKVVKEESEDFAGFLKWAPTLLSDFAEIDRYLVDPKNIFSYVNEARALEYWNVNGEPLTNAQKNYLKFWELLGDLYFAFNTHLEDKKITYAGKQFREVAGKINALVDEFNDHQILFAGFNALSTAEDKIIYTLIKRGKARIYWDADDYYLKSNIQEAGRFMRRNMKNHPTIPFEWSTDHLMTDAKNINIVNCNTDLAQAKYVSKVLSNSIQPIQPTKTAVVLNNEELLMPILYNLPKEVDAANITMGYPLKLAPLTSLIFGFIDCWMNSKGEGGKVAFYFKTVFQLIEHPLFSHLLKDKNCAAALKKEMVAKNVIYVGRKRFDGFFAQEPITALLFNTYTETDALTKVLLGVLDLLKNGVGESEELSDLEQSMHTEYIYHYTVIFRKLLNLTEKSSVLKSIPIKLFKKLINQLVSSESVAFFGEPLKGLQIMGMLETRMLDFENVIMLSVNEGVLPKGKKDNSFIPYDIKKEFQLPTHYDHDAIFANHFYRLLQRAKNIDLVYVTGQSDFGASAERSRFIEQLEVELPKINTAVKINHVNYNPSPKLKDQITEFDNSEEALSRIKKRLSTGISPSALNKFIACPLDFYYRYVLRLGELDEVEEDLKNSTFGTCVHNTLEILFEKVKRQNLKVVMVAEMKKTFLPILTKEFLKHLDKDDLTSGNNLLTFEVAQQYIKNFLDLEVKNIVQAQEKKQDYQVISLEDNLKSVLTLNTPIGSLDLKLDGFADRVEQIDGKVRLIDYKTGKVEQKELTIKSWEELAINPDRSKALQLALYGYSYCMTNPGVVDFSAGIYSFRNLKDGALMLKMGNRLVSAADLKENMPGVIEAIVAKMLDPALSFKHNEKSKYCNYC